VPSPLLSILCVHPRPCCTTSCTATTALTLLSTRGRDAATPATAPRADHCQQLPRARLKMPRSTTTPPPSKSLLFKHRTRHDTVTGARFVRTAINSTATRVEIVRYACNLLPSWPIKGGAAPSRGGRADTGRRTTNAHALSVFPTILALTSITSLGTCRTRLLSRLACSHPSTGTPV
jgi:hypothetical protein